MITVDQALDRLIESCPSFLGATDLYEYMQWSEEEDTPDPFVRVATFAQHVVRLAEAGDADDLPTVFTTLDQLIEEGDPDTVELVRLGFVESLQNICSHEDVKVTANDILPLLGPAATDVWIELEALWAAASQSLHDVPRASEGDYLGVDDPNLKLYLRIGKRRLPNGSLVSATDILRYETAVADATWRSPEARRRVNVTSLVVGLALALALAIAIFR
ncbi:MAG: hypothetical protein HYX32_08295 [Actinobacteria bacterium]|nr:hypothetical protein [Actinomycetota bacterium]